MFVGVTLNKIRINESDIKKRRRVKIKQVAKRLFVEQGISDTSIQQIAEEAGIGRRTIYYYYDNKDEIIIDIQEDFISRLQKIENLEEGANSYETGISRMKYILERLTERYIDHLEEIEYLNEFDKYIKNTENVKFTSLDLDDYHIYSCLYQSLELGMEDNTIKEIPKHEIKDIILTINHTLIALVSRVGLQSDYNKRIYDYDIKDCKNIVSLLTYGLTK